MKQRYVRLALIAAAGSMAAAAVPASAEQWRNADSDRRWQSRAQGDYRSDYSRSDRPYYDGRYEQGYDRQWGDQRGRGNARGGDQWRYDRPYSPRVQDRLSWSEFEESQWRQRWRDDQRAQRDWRDMQRQRDAQRGQGMPSYPSDFYAGRGPDQYQGRQYMPPGFDYYDFYGAERPSNRPDMRNRMSERRMSDRGMDDARWNDQRMRERENAAMAERDRYWRDEYRRWARGQRDLYDGRYQLPDYDGDFAGSTGVGMGDLTGRGVGMPDYYQGERGGSFHRNPERWARIMRAQERAEQEFRDGIAPDGSGQEIQDPQRRSRPPVARAVAGDDDRESAQSQPDIPGQSQGSVGHPRQAQTTGQGQGVIETNTDEPKQPDTQIPEQSLRSLGHPEDAETTGQGAGVAEQPAGNNNTQR